MSQELVHVCWSLLPNYQTMGKSTLYLSQHNLFVTYAQKGARILRKLCALEILMFSQLARMSGISLQFLGNWKRCNLELHVWQSHKSVVPGNGACDGHCCQIIEQ